MLAIIGIVLFLKLSSPAPVAPNINQPKNTNQNTNQAQSFISAELEKEFQLRVNQVALLKSEDLKIKFSKVTEETRCPSDVVCKTGGKVTIVISISKNDQSLGDFSLTLGGSTGYSKSFGEYVTGLIKVEPYPVKDKEINLSDYTATLIITKTPKQGDKLSPLIISGQVGDWARKEPGKIDIIVRYNPIISTEKIQEELTALGAKIIFFSGYFQRVTVRIDESKVQSLADFEWVTWVEPIPPPPTTDVNNINTQCSIDDDCTLINKDINYQACWPGRCETIDYLLDKYIAVNKKAFEEFRLQEANSRPSDEECGPAPLCPVQLLNDNFIAKCIDNVCQKVSKQMTRT